MYNLTSTDEQHCLMVFQPGEHQELKTERLNAFKDRCKKIKQKLNQAQNRYDC